MGVLQDRETSEMPTVPARRLATPVWIQTSLIALLARDAADNAPNETGGILMGYWAGDSSAVVVTESVPGGPRAVHERLRFEPDSEWQSEQVARRYQSSGRVETYLGDWHSHPGGSARPSSLDRMTARAISASSGARAPRPLFIIVALRDQIEIRAHILRGRRFHGGALRFLGGGKPPLGTTKSSLT